MQPKALKFDCPACGAKAGNRCVYNTGELRRKAHKERAMLSRPKKSLKGQASAEQNSSDAA